MHKKLGIDAWLRFHAEMTAEQVGLALAVVGAAQATGPGDPAGDPGAFARALTLALAVSVVFSGSAILLSAVEVHRQRRH